MSTSLWSQLKLPDYFAGPPLALLLVSLWAGSHFLLRGLRGDILDAMGVPKAPRWLYIVVGLVLLFPAFGYFFWVYVLNLGF